jgi:hypothetical protein
LSAHVTGLVFARYPEGGGEMLLALALADHCHDDGTSIWPSVALLAKKTRQSERTVQYQLRKMEASGWLQLVREEQRGRPGFERARRRGREYRISPEWMAGGDPVPPQPAVQSAEETEEKGAKIAPFSDPEKGATDDRKGCNPEQKRVQPEAEKGATAVAPEPSVNHQRNIREGRASARDPTTAPDNSAHGADNRNGGESRFPITWQPDAETAEVLRARDIAMPAKRVIDGFVGHWAGKLIDPRRIPFEFVKWIARQHGIDDARAHAGQAGVLHEEADAAWAEVRTAGQRGVHPRNGWSHARTDAVLRQLGGFGAFIANMLERDVEARQKQFIRTFIKAGEADGSRATKAA